MLPKSRAASLKDAHRTRDELSRILDPSYTSSSPARTSTYSAYVDAQGNMHDPDYRDFPLIQQTSQYSAKRRSTKSSARPHWELVDEESSLLIDDEDLMLSEDTETGYYSKRNSWTIRPTATTTSSARHYPPSRRSSYPPRSNMGYSGAILSPADISPPTSWSSSSSSSESCSPASTCFSVLPPTIPTQQRPFDAGSERSSRCRIASSLKRKRRSAMTAASSAQQEKEASKKSKRVSHDCDDETYTWTYRREEEPVAEEEEDVVPRDYGTDEEEDEDVPRSGGEDADSVPTCTEALSRRWQALTLSIRFSMFRAERRIKRRVKSLI